METVGVYLRKERESKNISLREVSRITKISEFYLDYIEKDDYEKLPQGPYIKGYISSYSRLIGGNVDEALKLYDSLNKKTTQPQEIQTEILKDNGGNNPPEKPTANVWKKSSASLLGKIRSSFKTLVLYAKTKSAALKAATPQLKTISLSIKKFSSSLIASTSQVRATACASMQKVFSLKAAGASIKTIGPLINKKRGSLKNIVSNFKRAALTVTTNQWVAHRQIWLYACITLCGAGILVLAGFGFYHLFIYEKHRPIVSELKMMPDSEAPSLPAMTAEEKVLPPKSNDASIPSTQLEESHHNAGQKPAPSLSPKPEADRSRTTSIAEKSSNTSKLADQESAPPSSSTLVAETAAASQPAIGQENRVPPSKTQMAVNPSPGSATAIVHLKVLKASICSGIKDRMPAGTGTSFPPSVQRVYVWSQIEAKQIPSKIRHIYYFKGQKISDVTLDIRSPNWRTWSYKRISNNRYRGQWRVDIATAGGKVLRRLYFQIK